MGVLMKRTATALLAIAAIGLPLIALAQGDDAEKAFKDVMDKMHMSMSMDYAGDPDVHFVKSMIPHHQGAIDMARVVLAHGKDAQIRKLAEEVIKAQEGEIAMMREWLKKKGVQ